MAMDFTFERQLELEVADARDEAREEGLAEGRAEGKAEGRAEIILLMQLLLKDGRMEDLSRSTEDEEFCQQLMNEYGLIR